jgi:choline transport protein
MLGTSIIGLINGGTAGLIWLFLVAWVGFMAVNTSMAEMASMAPTSGGQYHWVSEFSPRRYQKILSFITGWFCVLGWQTGAANTAFLAGTQIQGLIIVSPPPSTKQDFSSFCFQSGAIHSSTNVFQS